jgi:hypothetical protein
VYVCVYVCIYVTCITIIDTIILTNYTKNAYIFDTYTPLHPYALQNGVIYFWNLHVHLFRRGLYTQAMGEVQVFVVHALSAFDSLLSALPSPGRCLKPNSNSVFLTYLHTPHVFYTILAALPPPGRCMYYKTHKTQL